MNISYWSTEGRHFVAKLNHHRSDTAITDCVHTAINALPTACKTEDSFMLSVPLTQQQSFSVMPR